MVPAVIAGGVLSITVVYVVEDVNPQMSEAITVITAGHDPAVLAVNEMVPGQLSKADVAARAAASAAPTVG
jgi:hypothetical protein